MLKRFGAGMLTVLGAALVCAAEAADSAYSRGLEAYRAGSYGDAAAAFDEALRERPEDFSALYYRGLTRARDGHLEQAIADLTAAEPRLPDVPVAADLGVALYYAGRRDEARTWLTKATDQRASAPGAHLLLGILAYEDGDIEVAQRALAEADASGDASVRGTAAYYLGLIAVRTSRQADARGALEQAQAAGEPAVAQAASTVLAEFSGEGPVGGPPSDLRPYSLRASAGFQYDSNVQIADIPLNQRQALPFSDRKNDGRFIVNAGASYYVLADERALLQLNYDLYQSVFFDVERLDLQGHTVSGVFEYGDGILVPGIQGSYSYFMTDGSSSYLGRAFGSPYLVVQEEGLGQTELFYAITGDNYMGAPFNPYRDGINNAVGGRQVFFLGSPDRRLDIGYRWHRTSTDGSSAGSRDFDEQSNQVDVGLSVDLPELVFVDIRWLFSNDDYLHGNSRSAPVVTVQPDGTRTLTRLRRRDDRNVLTLFLSRALTDNVWASLGYYFTDSGSNLPVFQYSRHILSANVGVTF